MTPERLKELKRRAEKIPMKGSSEDELIAEVERLKSRINFLETENAELKKMTEGGPYVLLQQYQELEKQNAELIIRVSDLQGENADYARTNAQLTHDLDKARRSNAAIDRLSSEYVHRSEVRKAAEEMRALAAQACDSERRNVELLASNPPQSSAAYYAALKIRALPLQGDEK